ncbi:ketoacyl-ACP synthase III [Saccharomonospora sp. NPDC006951]
MSTQESRNTRQSVGVLGTGSYLPKDEVSNEWVAGRAGVTAEWIERKTRIKSRRYAAPTEATSDLATLAAESALDQAGIGADRLSYIVVATSTPDSPQPPTSALVQHELGAYDAACFDINVVCSGFVYGIELTRALLLMNPGTYALVIGADVYSRILNYDDRATSVLLGDGAGAVVLGPAPVSYGIVDARLRMRGDANELIKVAAGGSRLPTSHETVDAGAHYFTMRGRRVSEFVLDQVPLAVADLLHQAGATGEQIDHIVPHQPNGNLLAQLVEKLAMPNATTHRSLERYGNVGSACIPVTLDEANRAGELADGELVLLAAFGGGMSIGSCLLRWSA